MPQVRIVLAGHGFLGSRIAAIFAGSGNSLAVVKRSPAENTNGTVFVGCDLTMEKPHFSERNFSAAIFCLSPGSRDPVLYERTYVHAQKNFLASVDPDRYVYISSTAVYPDAAGDYDEESASVHSDRARILLEAEDVALRQHGAVVLRLAGLYSSARRIFDARKASYSEDRLIHLIHVNDAARAVAHALTKRLTGVYNVHDGSPQRRSEILARMGLSARGMQGFIDRKISSAKFSATGFRAECGNYFMGISVS